jgi:hypothetical protein
MPAGVAATTLPLLTTSGYRNANGTVIPSTATGNTGSSTGKVVLAAAVQGSDANVLSAGAVSGTGATLCTDANGGATTNGCSAPASTLPITSTQAAFFDDFFTQVNLTDISIGSQTGATMANNNIYEDQNHPGNMVITSGTGGAGTGLAMAVGGAINGSVSQVVTPNSSLGWTWKSAVIVPVLPATTAASYQAGLSPSWTDPWSNSIGFRLSSTNSVQNDWYCMYNSTLVDSTVAATTNWVPLQMTNDGSKMHWYINGAEVCGTGVTLASLPSNTMFLQWTTVGQSATSVKMAVDYVSWARAVSR